MSDIAALYAEGRGRITELMAGVSDEDAKSPVATCPAWSVHDVVSHLAGTCADILSGNLAGLASDAWTAAQVEARRDRPVAEVVGEWNELAPQVEAFANNFPGRVGDQWVTDQTTHEHDIRLALGRPGGRESDSVRVGANFMVGLGLNSSLSAFGLGPLEVRGDTRTWIVGGTGVVAASDASPEDAAGEEFYAAITEGRDVPETGSSVGSLALSDFELMRALTGRRSRAQIAAYPWQGVDPASYLAAFQFGPFTISPVDIEE